MEMCNCRGTEDLNEQLIYYVYHRGSSDGINHNHESHRENSIVKLSLNGCEVMHNKFILHAIKDKENLKRFGFACLHLSMRVIHFQLYLRIIANPRYKSYHEIM